MNEPGDASFTPPAVPIEPAAGGNPWEQRDRLGFGAGLVESVKLFVVDPSEGFARTLRQGDYVSPLLFAVIVGWVSSLIGRIWQFVFQGSLLSLLPPEIQDQLGFLMAGSAAGLIFEMILWPILTVVGLFIGTAIFHLTLMMVGGLSQSKSGFEGTFRVNSYSSVAQLGQLIPILGGLIAFVWWVVLLTIGASSLHETSRGRALTAVLIPLFACCGLLLVTVITIVVFASLDQ